VAQEPAEKVGAPELLSTPEFVVQLMAKQTQVEVQLEVGEVVLQDTAVLE
jgi:hypothetical protein